jgi:phosphate-selective porin OprO/OprP
MPRPHRITLAALVLLGGSLCALTPSPAPAADLLTDCPCDATDSEWPPVWNLAPNVTARLRGRVDTDAIWSTQSPANEATFGDLGDVVGLRRARIGIKGDLGSDGRYIFEIDLASGSVVPRDMYLAHGDRQEFGETELGHFREPFSLEGGTSARYFDFMERSPVNLLDPARNWGLGLFRESLDENSSLGFGVFHAGTGTWDFEGGPGSTVDFTGRLTIAPINSAGGTRLLHFGLALSERVPLDGDIIINQQPRSPLLELGDSSTSPFVPVINIPASFQQLANLQIAANRGPLWAQAEWYGSWIDQTGGGTVFFHGSYCSVGYFLTGEHRGYDSSNGTLGAVRVNSPWLRAPGDCDRPQGWGAWELTARFAYLDFIDADTPPGPGGQPLGIRLPQSTFGTNWYLSDRVRLMFNYSYAIPSQVDTGTSSANIFASRLAVFW